MHISRIVVRNFRNFRTLDVRLNPGVTCIVGENNTGKTNLLHALRLPIDAALSSQYRALQSDDFPSGTDITQPQHVLISLELKAFAGKPNEEAMVANWAIEDDLARISYRFRPKEEIIEASEGGAKRVKTLALDDYHWQIRGAGGDCDPLAVQWHQEFGTSVRFDELQQFLVVLMHPLRDVEQSLRQSKGSPLARLIAACDIPQTEQASLVEILEKANDQVSKSTTIAKVGKDVDESFADTAGKAFRLYVELGMAAPSFSDISRSLTVLLSNKAMKRFDPRLNGLGLNNVLYIAMLLKSFENRISAGKTPGQLLLVEEPEAHLHPQLQRVLFSALREREFQTIATTHSTHITSQVTLDSIVVLTDDGTAWTSSCVPTNGGNLTPGQIADLERYLDATRATLLYAKKVILVEGPAELFLIPAIVKQVKHIALDELGISVVPIYGVHFAAYAKLFGAAGIRKKCAIIADGDLIPSDATVNDDGEDVLVTPSLDALENDWVKIFKCMTTFERAMTSVRTLPMFAKATEELGLLKAAARMTKHHASLLAGKNDEVLGKARDVVLAVAKRVGKARFAQVCSKHVGLAEGMPRYIADAVEWLTTDAS